MSIFLNNLIRQIIKTQIKMFETVLLTHDNSAWITTENLPNTLSQYTSVNFNKMFDTHDESRGRVLVFNKDRLNPRWNEIECSRWCKSYLNTPKFDNSVMKNYMFSGLNIENINDELPTIFEPLYNHMKKLDGRYNQVVVNYYGDNNDYIPQHSDCEAGMVDNHKIAVMNLCENSDGVKRIFKLKAKSNIDPNILAEECDIQLEHCNNFTMCGDTIKIYSWGGSNFKI